MAFSSKHQVNGPGYLRDAMIHLIHTGVMVPDTGLTVEKANARWSSKNTTVIRAVISCLAGDPAPIRIVISRLRAEGLASTEFATKSCYVADNFFPWAFVAHKHQYGKAVPPPQDVQEAARDYLACYATIIALLTFPESPKLQLLETRFGLRPTTYVVDGIPHAQPKFWVGGPGERCIARAPEFATGASAKAAANPLFWAYGMASLVPEILFDAVTPSSRSTVPWGDALSVAFPSWDSTLFGISSRDALGLYWFVQAGGDPDTRPYRKALRDGLDPLEIIERNISRWPGAQKGRTVLSPIIIERYTGGRAQAALRSRKNYSKIPVMLWSRDGQLTETNLFPGDRSRLAGGPPSQVVAGRWKQGDPWTLKVAQPDGHTDTYPRFAPEDLVFRAVIGPRGYKRYWPR